MQNTSEIWDSLAAEVNTRIEARATINGVTYTDIEPPVITRSLMQQGCSVGNVVSAMCALTLDTSNTIPKSASVFMEMRLVGGTEDEPVTSEWLPVGTFYVSNRKKYPQTTITDFVCYDALLKANAVWEPESSVWPQQSSAIASEIAGNIGLTFDSRTSITSYDMSQPDAGTTMRDVLGIIAQQNGGNWIVTPENKLRLVPIIDLGDSEESEEIVDINAVIDDYYIEDEKTITGVRYQVDDAYALLGNDNGIVIDVTIPGIIAGYLYDAINGYTYRPFTFGAAYYNPAIELGDFINYGGDISILCSEEITLGPYATGDISAPDVDEMGDEYPYVGSSEKVLYAAKSYAEIVADAARDEAIDAAAADLADAVLEINSDIEDLQDQIDGNITTWFYSVDPSLSNPPASNWTTTAEKNNHLGDLYYNTTNGYCWRFMLSNNVYSWSRITDTDIATALARAQHAQDTADGKRRVFVVQPTPPYDVGDLWVEGSSGDIKKCVTAKAEGASYAAADWALASKYTDDTAVSTLNNSLNQQEIFNRLTDNGTAQGIVLYDGQLYINAGYINAGYLSAARIKGDTLTLGGDNNVNGVLRVLDANGAVVVALNNNGADISNGSIINYSSDKTYRAVLSDGFLKFQYYNSAAQPIGWRNILNLSKDNSAGYTDASITTVGDLRINGGGGLVLIENKTDSSDTDTAAVQLDEDEVLLLVSDYGANTWLSVAPAVIQFSLDDHVGNPYVFELSKTQSSNPLSVGNGGTGANTAAGARTNLGITPANIGAVAKSGDTMTGTLTAPAFSGPLTGDVTGNCSGKSNGCQCPRVKEDANTLPGKNTFLVKEYTQDSAHLPSTNWYFLLKAQGSDSDYGAELALGMTTNRVFCRNYTGGTWNSWNELVLNNGTWGISITGNAATATKATQDGNGNTITSTYAKVASHNNLIAAGNEFTFAASGQSGPVWFNYRTAGGTNGNITEYEFGNGKGGALASITSGNFNGNCTGSAGKIAITETSITTDANGYVSIPNATLNPTNSIIDYAYVNTAGIAVIIGCGSNGANYRFYLYNCTDTFTRHKAALTVYYGYHRK